jgi:hypothetical protein
LIGEMAMGFRLPDDLVHAILFAPPPLHAEAT